MIRKLPARGALCAAVFSALTLSQSAFGQTPAANAASDAKADDKKIPVEKADESIDETIVLSPFTIQAEEDKDSYKAKSTLAGARVRTDLRDVSTSITVVTGKFLQDTGATNAQGLMIYTPNTEIGGVYGNYGGMGSANGLKENSALLRPSGNNRVRGLDSADNTRDFFQSSVPWDSYNVERVDMQRGANSILFGVGSPAGISNVQTIVPDLRKTGGNVQQRMGSFGSMRYSLDGNYVFEKDVAAIRVAAVDDDTRYRQDPAYNHDRRLFVSAKVDPKLFGEENHTSIKVSAETGRVRANRPRQLAPIDQITPFFMNSSQNSNDSTEPTINRQSYDNWKFQFTELTNNGNPANNMGWNTGTPPGKAWNPWVNATMARLGSADPVFWYDANSGAPFRVQQSNGDYKWGIKSDGTMDGGIDGLPFAHPVSINGYNQYTKNAEIRALALQGQPGYTNLPDPFPGAQKNYYKDKSLTDPTIFDFYNKLIDGPNKYENEDFNNLSLDITQSFLNNRISINFVMNKESYKSRQAMNLSDTPFISIDVNKNLIDNPEVYGAVSNPGFGRAYVGSSGHYGNNEHFTDRQNYRLTAVGELRATDLMEKSWLSDLLGRHVFNAVAERNVTRDESRNFIRYGTDINWALANNETTSITQGFRNVDWITYLSGSLAGQSSARGANISNITAPQSPYGQTTVKYFNSRWKPSTNPSDPSYVSPAAAWTNPFYTGASTQSENPANYVGWTTMGVNILNADNGDINQLYTDGNTLRQVLSSKAFTWQGYFLDGVIVPTLGYRQDRVKSDYANAPSNSTTGVASMGYGVTGNPTDTARAHSRSLGVVIHTPKSVKKYLPFGSDISLLYNYSENERAQVRPDFEGDRLPNAKGNTEEYGIVLSALDDRISFKAVRYLSKVKNGDLSGDPATSTLGANTYWLYLAQAWGTGSAVADLIGLTGNDNTGSGWYWDWANHDISTPYGAWPRNPASAAIDAQELAAAKDWVNTMPSQKWFDAYGIPINVANIKAAAASGSWSTNWGNYIGGGWAPYTGPGQIQAAGAGKIAGIYPVAAADSESHGYEFEIAARPTDNWNISANASKTTAYRTKLNAKFAAYIEAQHARLTNDSTGQANPAGLLRTWWAGDTYGTFSRNFDNNIYSAYLFQKEQNGQAAPEVHPWALNINSDYRFTSKVLKGLNVGGAYRWQDHAILGYRLKKQPTVLDANNYVQDVNQPIYGPTDSHFDLWIGYERQLTKAIKWRTQLNLHNVGEKVGLIPVSVEPDGSPAAMRIQEGMTWQWTNTLYF